VLKSAFCQKKFHVQQQARKRNCDTGRDSSCSVLLIETRCRVTYTGTSTSSVNSKSQAFGEPLGGKLGVKLLAQALEAVILIFHSFQS
jgi:hypothetical protein